MATFRETDQVFTVGNFNVCLYGDPYNKRTVNYYGCELIKFNGNAVVKKIWIYFRKESEATYRKIWTRLHNKSLLEVLIMKRNYSCIAESEVNA